MSVYPITGNVGLVNVASLTNLWLPSGEGVGGMNWETEIDMYTLLCVK